MRSWDGLSQNQGTYPGERFRVDVTEGTVDLVWYLPNPHAGHEGGESLTLDAFLASERHRAVVAEQLGEAVLREVLDHVRSHRP